MSKYKYLLFDADNTLFDFDRCEREAVKLALDGSSVCFSDGVYDAYHKINDDLWKALERGEIERDVLKVERFRLLFEKYGVKGDEYRRVASLYEKRLAEQSFEIEGVNELLGRLARDYSIYVITNGLTSVQRGRFQRSRLSEYFTSVFISEEIGVAKPSREFFDHALSFIGDPDRSKYLVIGDSLTSDIDGAINSGIECCWYNRYGADPAGRCPDYIAADIGQIEMVITNG